MRSLIILLPLLITAACQSEPESAPIATMAVTDTRIWTGDTDNPWAEAMAVRGDEILARQYYASPLHGDCRSPN